MDANGTGSLMFSDVSDDKNSKMKYGVLYAIECRWIMALNIL